VSLAFEFPPIVEPNLKQGLEILVVQIEKRLPFILAEVQPLQSGGADGTRTRDLRRDRPAF
jgi:hypothetical protein